MTRPHDDHAKAPGVDADRAEQIRAELAALGEAPADDDELAFASAAGSASAALPPADVRTVATLVELSAWVSPAASEGLLPLAGHRVWQRVAARVAVAPRADEDVEAPAANGASGWRGVLASLALVAGVALVLRVDVAPPPSDEDRAALASMGQATRAALEATVPGEQDGARARALAQGYAERLAAERGAER
jgi:hypothetical protein